MKKIIILFLTLCVISSGCDSGYSRVCAGAQGHDDLLQLVAVAVPHMAFMDTRLDYMKILETDAYGRRLFWYYIVNSGQKWLLISQKSENSSIFYYEDFCYSLCSGEDDNPTEEEIKWLKDINDWNQPIAEDKMISVAYSEEIVSTITEYNTVRKNTTQFLKKMYDAPIDVMLNPLETFGNGQQVFLITVSKNNEDWIDYYLAIYDHYGQETISVIEPIDDMDNIRQKLISFKAIHKGQEDLSAVPSDEHIIDPK